MALSSVLAVQPGHALLIIAVLIVGNAVRNRYFTGLRDIPGPLAASCTDLWRLYHAWTRRPEQKHIDLHAKYGSTVRIGPRSISFSDPSAAATIYALNSGFVKSDFYVVQQTIAKGRRLFTLFTSTDERFHSKLRRAVANSYAMSTLVQFEQYVDSTTAAFIQQMKLRFADRPDRVCDLSTWLQWYAFDVIGELTFSKRLGFIDRGEDVEGIIASIEWMLNYAAVVGQMPFLDNLLLKNPIRLLLSRYGLIDGSTYMVTFARKRLAERIDSTTGLAKQSSSDVDADVNEGVGADSYVRNDFLSRFMAAHAKDPSFITNDRVLALTVANVFAGSDTTAISLRAVFYYLLKNPACMRRLLAELRHQQTQGLFRRAATDGLVDWTEVRDLPYLGAVIKESLRCHPAAGLTLERITPRGGATIGGTHIPGGTIVGCSAWTLHQNEEIFGDRPGEFRPERWLDSSSGPAEQQQQQRQKRMENTLFTFGAGARTCIGKNISLLEMYKFVPAVLMAFEIEFPDPESEWTLHNAWFVKQSNFKVRIKTRKGVDWGKE